MKTQSLERIMKPASVTFYDDAHPHPEYGKHVYVALTNNHGVGRPTEELYTGCTTIAEAWDKSFFLGPWYAKEMCLEILSRPFDVVTKLSPPEFEKFITAAKGAAKRKSEQAKLDGTRAHDWISSHIQSKMGSEAPLLPTPESPEAMNAINAFLGWVKGKDITWLASEEVVSSDEHHVGGKLDGIAVIDGLTYLVDFKTSGQLSPSYLIQCAGYDLMLREMGLQVMGYLIVRIPKDGKETETLTITNQKDMQFFRDTFLKQREAHRFYAYMESKFKDMGGKMKVDAPLEKAA